MLAAVLIALSASGLGADALGVIANVLRHEAPPPGAAPPMVRELLEHPLDAADASAVFRRAVPAAIAGLVDDSPSEERNFQEALAAYIDELAEAQKALRAATGAIDDAAILLQLEKGLVSADPLLAAAAAVDAGALEHANARFIDATARFARSIRGATGLPREALRFDSAIGIVSVGTRGNDRHGPDAAVIVDPGGDDRYDRAPLRGGAVSVIVDLAGNDLYAGSDLAVRGLAAIIDLSGDDRYEMQGPGLGAAIVGASLLLDGAGDDRYRSGYFGQGAAAFGVGALVDFGGNDRYELRAWGQGFGLAGGIGLLWDRAGNDRYAAAGEPDAFGRGAGLSGAQGAAFGYRSMLGGGIGILRDDSGDDVYTAEMFAQGLGYFYGVGVLWDGGGADRYRAVRYAQGAGVHQAVGILRDEAGADRYQLGFGVGQGMGLDLAVGALIDATGDDEYRAPLLAQGAATANGIGLLADGGGSDRWEIGEAARAWGWGQAEWLRGLPSVGLLLHDPARATFAGGGATLPPPAGPDRCEGKAAFGLALRLDDFEAVLAAGAALRCAILQAGNAEAIWSELERHLIAEPATPLAAAIARVLSERPAAAAQRDRLLRLLEAHPRCSVRALALAAAPRPDAVDAALRSSCWQLQAAALAELARLGAAPDPGVSLPSFLAGRELPYSRRATPLRRRMTFQKKLMRQTSASSCEPPSMSRK